MGVSVRRGLAVHTEAKISVGEFINQNKEI